MNHRDNLNAALPDEIAALARHPNKTVADIFSVPRHPIMYTKTGYILRLHVMNFLTHRDKVVDFQCPVSLIHGPNGAGKSSILQAIHFVLGGKAKNIRDNCEKFSNLKTVVCLKDTKTNVQISQCSVIAYFYHQESNEFPGPIIGLKRTITNEVANFFLCSSFPSNSKSSPQFERIPSERAHSILVGMGHFPDNEITMVSQSRMKVLVRMKPADRYRIFSTAVSFDEIESNLVESQASLERSNMSNKIIGKRLMNFIHERKRAGKKIKAMKEYYEMEVSLNKAGLRKVALCIQKHRVHVQNHRLDVDQAEGGELAQLSAEYERQQNAKANLEPYLKRCTMEIDELTARLDKDKSQLMDLFGALAVKRSELEETVRRADSLESGIKAGHEEAASLKKNIAQHTELLSKATDVQNSLMPPEKDEEYKRLESDDLSLQMQLAQLQTKKRKLEADLLDIERERERRQDREKEARRNCENAEDQLDYLQQQLKLATSDTTASEKCIRSLLESNRQIYNRVKEASFSNVVIAPLAAYIWVKAASSELAPIIRRTINRNLLETIAFKDKTDEQRLRDILGKKVQLLYLLKPQTPTMDDFNKLIHELDPRYKDKVLSVMQCLGTSSPFAFEVLQLKIGLSRLVICETIEIARIVLETGRKLQVHFQCLPKDRECIMFLGGKNSVVMKPAYNNYGSAEVQTLYLATSNTSDIQKSLQYQKRVYDEAKAELEFKYSAEKLSIVEAQEALKKSEVQRQLEPVSAELTRISQAIEANSTRLTQLQTQYAHSLESYMTQQKETQKEQKQIERSRTIVESSSSKLTALEDRLIEMTDDLEKAKASLKGKRDALDQQERQYQKCEGDVNALEDELSKKISHRENIQADNLDKQISQTEKAISACKVKINTLKEFLSSAQNIVLNDLRTFLEVFENLSSLVPEYKEAQSKFFANSTGGVQPCNPPVGDGAVSAEQASDKSNSSFKELHALLRENASKDSIYHNELVCMAFLLVDFVADYTVFEGGQDAKHAKSIPENSHGDNEQLLVTINNLLSNSSENIQKIEEKRQELAQNFTGDIEQEKRHLLEMEEKIQDLKKQHGAIQKEIASIGGLAVQQIVKLTSIRSRAEHDVSFHFKQTSELTGTNQRLYFQFPALPTVSSTLLDIIDKQIADQYYDICGAQLHASWGVEPPSRLDADASSASDDAHQQPTVVIAKSKGSIDIRSKTRGVTSLSGGESTFISLCFMFSCWLVIRTRYAQIDEWDVFMDAMRRKKAFKLMMDAILQTSVQVVLVTPSDVDINDFDETTKKAIGVIRLLSIRN